MFASIIGDFSNATNNVVKQYNLLVLLKNPKPNSKLFIQNPNLLSTEDNDIVIASNRSVPDITTKLGMERERVKIRKVGLAK
jgi:hypothetical protein